MKDLLQSIANRYGYRISKIRPRPECEYIEVFALVAQDLAKHQRDIVAVQIGANDGQRADPLHPLLRKYGWRAILVEPQPRAFEQLQQTYADFPAVSLENCVIARQDGEVDFYTVADHVDFRWTGLAQLNRDRLMSALVAQGFDRDDSLIKSIRVPALTVASLLRKHGLDRMDILQIDAEGFDYEIVKMVDFERSAPALIHYEHANVPLDQHNESWEYLARFGYRLAMIQGDTIAYRQPMAVEAAV